MKDAYTWRIMYRDETTLDEYDADYPSGRGFAEANTAQVKALALLPTGGLSPHSLLIPDGDLYPAKPVFFRRRRIEIDPIIGTQHRNTTHCIGWTQWIDNTVIEVYLFVFEDGSTLLTDNLQAV